MNFDNFKRVGSYSNDKLEWYDTNKKNIVYAIRFPDDSFYIGSTKDLRRRFSMYLPAFKHNRYESIQMQDAFNRNRAFDIYEIVSDITDEELLSVEYKQIDNFSPTLNSRKPSAQKYVLDLKKVIKKYGVTQSFLAERWGVYQSAVSQMLGGGKMSLEKLYDLADACGCTVSELLQEENITTPSLTCPHCGAKLNISITAEEC